MAKIDWEDKSQESAYDAAKWNAQDANDVKESVNDLYDALPVKSYIGLVNSNPSMSATVIKNTFGGTIVWTNPENGVIEATLAGAFTSNKTVILINGVLGYTFNCKRISDNIVDITFQLHDGTQSGTPNFTNLLVTIDVYA